jgi:hypothetical protein
VITTTQSCGGGVVRITISDAGERRAYFAVANLDDPTAPLTVRPGLDSGLYDPAASVGQAATIDDAIVVAQEAFCMQTVTT